MGTSAQRKSRKAGFTLVEILIVVVILGILAAIVIPQFTNASESAKSSSLYTQLQTIRSQLELYQVQHNGDYPTVAELNDATTPWGVMVERTTVDGTVDAAGDFGPYLQQPPRNGFTGQFGVVAGTEWDATLGDPTTDGWIYDDATGRIWAVGFDEETGEYTAPASGA